MCLQKNEMQYFYLTDMKFQAIMLLLKNLLYSLRLCDILK